MRRDIFFGFHWYESASRKGIKKARDAITFRSEGIGYPKPRMYRALASPVLTDGTKQGLATFIPWFQKVPIFLIRYKELLLFIMFLGYAEL